MTSVAVDMLALARLRRDGTPGGLTVEELNDLVEPLVDAGLVAVAGDGSDRRHITALGVASCRVLLSYLAASLEDIANPDVDTANLAPLIDVDLLTEHLLLPVVAAMHGLGCIIEA